MSADELRERAVDRAKPKDAPEEPADEVRGLLDATHWDQFNLWDFFRAHYPEQPFWDEPVVRWPRARLIDFFQWLIAVKHGEEYVGEILAMWEALKVEQDEQMREMIRKARGE